MIRVVRSDEVVQIWSEPEEGDVEVGRCIGVGDTLREASAEAVKELLADLGAVIALPLTEKP